MESIDKTGSGDAAFAPFDDHSTALNILMISDVYYPRVNGVSTSIKTFVDAFLAMGHSVTLIAPDYGRAHASNFEVIRIPARTVPLDPEDRLMQKSAILDLVPTLAQSKFDILHIQTPFMAHYAGLALAESLKLKTVVSYHTFFEGYFEKYVPWVPKGWLRGAARRFSRRQCNQVDGVVSPSSQMLQKLRDYGVSGVARVIPTGLDLKRFVCAVDDGFRDRYGIAEDAFVMLYLGRVAHEKNIDFLIDAFALVKRRVRKPVLLIAGEGPAEEHINRMVSRMGLQDDVRFVGYLNTTAEVVACYRNSDVFVFASQTETQGLVLLEAMACGLPVVSTASLGAQDVLKEGQGCHIAPLDTLMFAEQVVLLANNRADARELGQRGERYVTAWSAEQKALDMLRFYREIIACPLPGDVHDSTYHEACLPAGEAHEH